MQDYIIMTDSCCDLTDQMARELELEVLPLTMTMDGEEYPNTLDGRYITNEEFYKRLRAGKTSTTAAANVGQFEDAMRTVLLISMTVCSFAAIILAPGFFSLAAPSFTGWLVLIALASLVYPFQTTVETLFQRISDSVERKREKRLAKQR